MYLSLILIGCVVGFELKGVVAVAGWSAFQWLYALEVGEFLMRCVCSTSVSPLRPLYVVHAPVCVSVEFCVSAGPPAQPGGRHAT